MRQTSELQAKWRIHRRILAFVALVVGTHLGFAQIREASSEPMVEDGAPSGMVTFVGGGVCPPGWVHVTELEGRAIVGTVTKEDIGIDVGVPFTDQEERGHDHAYTGSITLGPKPTGVPIGPNGNVAKSGTYMLEGTTTETSGALPFFQMEGCIKP